MFATFALLRRSSDLCTCSNFAVPNAALARASAPGPRHNKTRSLAGDSQTRDDTMAPTARSRLPTRRTLRGRLRVPQKWDC
jgi:hypothetical protein